MIKVCLVISRLPTGYVLLCSVPKGVRKDRIRVIRRDKRTPGTGGREKSSKDVQHKTAPPQDRRKQHSSGTGGAGGKSAVPGLAPEQVLDILDPVLIVRKPKLKLELISWSQICLLG